MKTMILIAAVLASPVAAQTQADMNRTGANTYRAADAALNVQYRRTMALMAQSDAGRNRDLKAGIEKPDGDPGYRDALLAAQRAWLAYRDAQCRLAGFEFRGGSAQSMAAGQCLTDLTKRRTAELRQIEQSLSPK